MKLRTNRPLKCFCQPLV
uniref:Uncharacterized protein n=1 Tax=Anguilla anguilla TaxID=7936 RepID=A0A0E9QSL4_ANGAN